jgi:hypothetical protein
MANWEKNSDIRRYEKEDIERTFKKGLVIIN